MAVPQFGVRATPEGSTVVVAGELDVDAVPTLRETLLPLIGCGTSIVVDLSRVTFMDAAATRAIASAARSAREHGGRVVVEHPSPPVARILTLAGLHAELAPEPALSPI